MKDSISVDAWILFAVAALVAIGITMVLSTSYLYAQERFGDGTYFFRKQLIAAGIGVVGLLVMAALPAAMYRKIAYPLMGAVLLVLIVLLIPGIGATRGGARRWLIVGGFAFQPAELAKLSLLLYLACSLAKKTEKMGSFALGVLPHLLIGGLFIGLIVLEPDLGTAVTLGLLLLLMLFIAGAKLSHLAWLGVAALPVMAIAVMGAEYRLRRLMTFLDPWRDASKSGFQIIQSYIAFGSGQVLGRGLGESRQKMFYLPEAHTDFIFSVIGEEMGLLGALGVLALFAVIIVRGLKLTSKIEEPFSQFLAFGLTALLGLQALIHMSVVMGLVPTKGLVLPFISYGGSAMMVNLIEAGMLLGLSRGRR